MGTAVNGTTPLVPDSVESSTAGVNVDGSFNTKVGGLLPGEANTIAFRGIGVAVITFNGPSSGNQIRGNSIHSNTGLGIDTRDGGNGEPPRPSHQR